jgi:putative Mn2+ efflux pump MntP
MDNKFSIINLNAFSWHLNVAIMGGAFAVFSLIYNEYYIYYGLITFVFGIFGHITSRFVDWFFKDGEKSDKYWIAHIPNVILGLIWIKVLIGFYC